MQLNGIPVIVHTRAGIRAGVITSETANSLTISLSPARGGGHVLMTHGDGSSTVLTNRSQPERLDISREDIAEDDRSGSIRKITLRN